MADIKPIQLMYVILRKSDRAYYTHMFDRVQALQYINQLMQNQDRYGYGYGNPKEGYLIVEYAPTRIIKQDEPKDLKEIEAAYDKNE